MTNAQKSISKLGACTLAVALTGLAATSAQAQSNILVNSGFETGGTTTGGVPAILANGTNTGVVPNSWAIGTGFTNNNSNLQQGANTNGSGATAIVLNPYDGTYSGGSTGTTGGTHFWDGVTGSSVTLTQSFTLSTTSNLSGTFALGGRDPGGASVNSTIGITRTSGTTGTFNPFTSANFSTADGVWQVKNFSLSAVPAGTYLFSINLAEQQNIDAVALVTTPVPEPSTWTMILGAGAVAVGIVRRRKKMVS